MIRQVVRQKSTRSGPDGTLPGHVGAVVQVVPTVRRPASGMKLSEAAALCIGVKLARQFRLFGL
jgi:hypothetical protein